MSESALPAVAAPVPLSSAPAVAAAGPVEPEAALAPARPPKLPPLPAATQAGMGALPHLSAAAEAAGATFRVWAPNADEVALIGSFNDWTAAPLHPEADGYWAADAPTARIGDEYKYLIGAGGQEFSRNDPYAREMTGSGGNSVVPDPHFDWGDDNFQMPAWNELVMYELHVGTFNPQTEQPGTFLDVAARLPYLRELGINCIEIMPPTEFPGGRSWGYNPAALFALETEYGGARQFRELVKQAHAHGIAVVLDVVYNHFGPDDLALWRFDGWHENEGGGIYFYNDWRAETPWGHNRPDYGRPAVRDYIRDNALMWLEDYRCDGLRLDAIAFVRNVHGEEHPAADLPDGWNLMRELNAEIQRRQPWKITIAEDLRGNAAITGRLEEGGQGFGAQWDGFVYPVREALLAHEDADRDLAAVAQAIATGYNGAAFQRVIYTESHDEVANGRARIPEEIMPGAADHYFPKKRATLGAALVMTAPGIPMLFQGQEFLADGAFSDDQPLRWERAEQHSGLVHLYRDLIALRRNRRGTTAGLLGESTQVFHVNNDQKVLAFRRTLNAGLGPGEDVIIIANFALTGHDAYRVGLPTAGRWLVRFNSDWRGYDGEFSDFEAFGCEAEAGDYDGFGWSSALPLAPYAALILSRE